MIETPRPSPYGEADFNEEVEANGGLDGLLSPEGQVYLRRILNESVAQGRREWLERMAKREANRLVAELKHKATVAEIEAATASAGREAPDTTSRREREHQKAITRHWDAAGY